MKEVIRFFDCFAGIGGFYQSAKRVVSEQYELRHVAYCEVDPSAQKFYDAACASEGVQKIQDVQTIKTKKNPAGTEVAAFDMLFAGFPCQSFSNVGYRKGFDDPRGQLFFYILDILDYYKPKYFVLENVQKIHTIQNGGLLAEMKKALRQIGGGYVLHTWNLLASDYGLPQKRNRIFFCGIRRDLACYRDISEPPPVDLSKAAYPTVWHLLERGQVDPRHYLPQGSRKIILTKPANWLGEVSIDNHIAKPLTASMAKWHRANQDNYFSESYITGTDPYAKPAVNLDTEPIRRITPLEGFRLQGFPDSYADIARQLGLPYSTQYRLIGNALPVDLGRAVIQHFLDSYLCQSGEEVFPMRKETSANEFEYYRSVLEDTLPYVEDDTFSWTAVTGFLILKLTNTDCLKKNKERGASNATQIQITSKRDAGGPRPTEDFFPTLTLNSSFKSWRLSLAARIHLENIEKLGGAPAEEGECWQKDSIQIRRRLLNGDSGNPTLHICYEYDLAPLREQLGVGDYLVIVKQRSEPVYEAFGVKEDVNLGRGKRMYLSPRASDDMTAFRLDDLAAEPVTGGRNVLLYGVPGCGKSHLVQNVYCQGAAGVERVVYHPDYTYGDFIGQILPTMGKDNLVQYLFTPGPFTRILKQALDDPGGMYCLIIEELNRGNAPAIFGDTFQLLDRDQTGNSKYAITNRDLSLALYGREQKVSLPANLSIFATMNTSDQNVFTLDNAFQRRWIMRMVPNDVPATHLANLEVLDTGVTWAQFVTTVNQLILSKNTGMVSSEDKRLGAYFVTEDDLRLYTEQDGLSPQEATEKNRSFPEKVLKYLWDDAFKFTRDEVFRSEYDSLDRLIAAFEHSTGIRRFDIFLDDIFGPAQEG